MRCLPDYKKEAFVSSRLPPHPACANCLAYTLPLGSAQATFPSKGNVINLSHLSTNFFARSKMSERIRLTRFVAAAVTPPNEDAAINKRFQNEASSQPIFSIPGIPIRFIAALRYGGVTAAATRFAHLTPCLQLLRNTLTEAIPLYAGQERFNDFLS